MVLGAWLKIEFYNSTLELELQLELITSLELQLETPTNLQLRRLTNSRLLQIPWLRSFGFWRVVRSWRVSRLCWRRLRVGLWLIARPRRCGRLWSRRLRVGLWLIARPRRCGRLWSRRRLWRAPRLRIVVCTSRRLMMLSMPSGSIMMKPWRRHCLDIRHFGMVRRSCVKRAASHVSGRAVGVVRICPWNHAPSHELSAECSENREPVEFVVHVTPLFPSFDK